MPWLSGVQNFDQDVKKTQQLSLKSKNDEKISNKLETRTVLSDAQTPQVVRASVRERGNWDFLNWFGLNNS